MFAKFTPKHKKHTIAITKLAEVVLKLVTNASQIAGKCQENEHKSANFRQNFIIGCIQLKGA